MSKNRFKVTNTQSTKGAQPVPDSNEPQQDQTAAGDTAGEDTVTGGAAEAPAPETSEQSQPAAAEEQAPVVQPEVNPVTQDPAAKFAAKRAAQQGFKPVFKIQFDLDAYNDAMGRGKSVDPDEGGKWQYSLFTTIRGIFGAKDQEEFSKEWTTLLAYFLKEKDGIFNENFLFRFPNNWPGSAAEFALFRRLAYVAIQTADPKTRRKELKDLDLEKVTEGLTEEQRGKFINFYA